jgi:hypothetical protein
MAPMLTEIRFGGQPYYLDWAAHVYFEGEDGGERSAGVQRVVDLTDDATAEAIVAGWTYLATTGLGDIDAAQLGRAEAENRRYYVEAATIAGLDRMIDEDRLPAPAPMPIEVAVAVLKSSYVGGGGWRGGRSIGSISSRLLAGHNLWISGARPSTRAPLS